MTIENTFPAAFNTSIWVAGLGDLSQLRELNLGTAPQLRTLHGPVPGNLPVQLHNLTLLDQAPQPTRLPDY